MRLTPDVCCAGVLRSSRTRKATPMPDARRANSPVQSGSLDMSRTVSEDPDLLQVGCPAAKVVCSQALLHAACW